MSNARRWSALGLPVAIVLVLATLMISLRVSAQGGPSHPAHIHQGTCEDLGDIVAPLDNLSFGEAAQTSGSEAAIPVKISETVVELPLADILAGQHAINIHESDDNIQEYIACGDIGGPVRGGELVIGLHQLNESGHTGVAVLEEAEGGTSVSVYLIEPAGGDDATADDGAADDAAATTDDAAGDGAVISDAAATADATADDDADDATDDAAADDTTAAPAGQEVAVDIVNFAYNPNPIEIAVGDTITWTNQDGVPHTATGQNRDLLQSGTIAPGASYSHTFTESGEIPYFCEFHPNMNGTVVVQ